MNNNDLRRRVEVAVERANLIDDHGEDLVTAFEARLAGLEDDLASHKARCRQLESENLGLNELLDQLLSAIEQDRFGDFFRTASERIAAITDSLEEDLNASPAWKDADEQRSEPPTAEAERAKPGKAKNSGADGPNNLTLVSNQPNITGSESVVPCEDDDVAVMEVVERLSSLTHELAETESIGS